MRANASAPAIGARWALLVAALLALILVPFALIGAQLDGWSVSRLDDLAGRHSAVALLIVVLLASDVLLPVPSSIVATMAGALLGFPAGAAAVWLGMTAGCAVAWAIGRYGGTRAIDRMVGDDGSSRLRRLAVRHGDWSLVLTRAVPVLAEAATIAAGASGMPLGRFLAITAAANLGIALVHPAVGVLAADVQSFLLAFAGAALIPLIARILIGGRA